MKLYMNKNCPHCESIDIEKLKVNIIYTDSDSYDGLMPPSVPLVQFNNGIQLIGGETINTIFDEIRNQK